jgi:hypothetical protein
MVPAKELAASAFYISPELLWSAGFADLGDRVEMAKLVVDGATINQKISDKSIIYV